MEMQCSLYSCVWDWKGSADITEYSEINIENLSEKLCEESSEISLELHKLIAKNIQTAIAQLSDDSEKNADVRGVLEKLQAQF